MMTQAGEYSITDAGLVIQKLYGTVAKERSSLTLFQQNQKAQTTGIRAFLATFLQDSEGRGDLPQTAPQTWSGEWLQQK